MGWGGEEEGEEGGAALGSAFQKFSPIGFRKKEKQERKLFVFAVWNGDDSGRRHRKRSLGRTRVKKLDV